MDDDRDKIGDGQCGALFHHRDLRYNRGKINAMKSDKNETGEMKLER